MSPLIKRVEVHVFGYEVAGTRAAGARRRRRRQPRLSQGRPLPCTRYAVTVDSSDGARGAYVTHWVGTPSALAQTLMLAPHLSGRDPETREAIYDDLKREVRAYDHMGHGPLDIALWDLAGKQLRRIGRRSCSAASARACRPTPAPTTARTSPAASTSPEAFADYALACKERASPASRSMAGTTATRAREARNVLGVREAVGDGWP